MLPGHLVVVRPEAIRLSFFDRLLDEGYGTRNRGVLIRRTLMIRRLLGALVTAELRSLAAGVAPTLTLALFRIGLWGARGLANRADGAGRALHSRAVSAAVEDADHG